MPKLKIIQNEKEPLPIEVLATSIRAIAAGIKALRKGPLGENALLLLIQDGCRTKKRYKIVKAKINIATIKSVLDSIEGLQNTYLK